MLAIDPDLHPALAGRVRLQRHESSMGSWTEAVCLPPPELAGAVQILWYGAGHVTYRRDRILPRGCSHLLLNLGPPQLLVDPGGGPPRVFEEAFFAGPQRTFLETESPTGIEMLGIAFHPEGAYGVLHDDQHRLVDVVVSLDQLVPAAELRQRLLEAEGPLGRLAVAEGWLLERWRRGKRLHPVTPWAVRRLRESGGRVRVEELSETAGYSRRYLWKVFRREVGLTPKTFGRVMRFHRALDALRRPGRRSWGEVALDCGYYDQSHLINDLQAMAGCTPGGFVAADAPDELTLVVQ